MTLKPTRHRIGAVAIAVAGAVVAGGLLPAGATPGRRDRHFGDGGIVITDFAGGEDESRAVAVGADGRSVVAGYASGSGPGARRDFALARYGAGGGLDTSFGDGGLVTTDFSGSDDQIEAVALAPDGAVVVAGCVRCLSATSDFAVARYRPDGTLDTGFGDGGLATVDFSDIDSANRFPPDEIHVDGAEGLAVAQDGSVVVVGCIRCLTRFSDFGLARFTADGRLDPTFDGDGRRVVDFAGSDVSNDTPGAVLLQPDGKIVAVGFAGVTRRLGLAAQGTTTDFALVRLLPDGAFDIGFGTGGKVTTDLTGNSQDGATAAALAPDGKIVAAGFVTAQGGFDFALARYDPAGRLDPSFGHSGVVTTDFADDDEYGYPEFAHAVAVGRDGSVIAAGCTRCTQAQSDLAVARYLPTGALDPTFAGDGTVVADIAGGRDEAFGVALGPAGEVLLAGASDGDGAVDFLLARYQGSVRGEVPLRKAGARPD